MFNVTIFPFNKKRYLLLIKEIKKYFCVKKIYHHYPTIRLEIIPKKSCVKNEVKILHKLRDCFYDIFVSIDGKDLIEEFASLLIKNRLTVAVAESCTGGLMANLLTSISGSSKYFVGGIVSYSNDVKINVLKVPKNVLENLGAVSKSVGYFMASSVKELLNSDIGISTTGIAGPLGGTKIKPVGTVCIGVVGRYLQCAYKIWDNQEDRHRNKLFFVYLGINFARILLMREQRCF